MIEKLALGHEIHETSVGDVGAVLDLQLSQLRTPPGHDGQAPVGQLGAAAQGHGLDRQLGPGVPRQQPEDGLYGEISVGAGPGQADGLPQARVPHEKVEPPTQPGARDQLIGGKERQNVTDDVIGKGVKVTGLV